MPNLVALGGARAARGIKQFKSSQNDRMHPNSECFFFSVNLYKCLLHVGTVIFSVGFPNLLLRVFGESGRCLCLPRRRIIVPGCWEVSFSHFLRSVPFRAAACDGCASVTARLRMCEWI